MFGKRPRDENGWRVPSEGTKARHVYDLLKNGHSSSEIRAACGRGADGHIFSIQNPDYAQGKVAQWRLNRMMARIQADPSMRDAIDEQEAIEFRLAGIEEERSHLLEQLKEFELRNKISEWVDGIGTERARAICQILFPDNPAYADANPSPAGQG